MQTLPVRLVRFSCITFILFHIFGAVTAQNIASSGYHLNGKVLSGRLLEKIINLEKLPPEILKSAIATESKVFLYFPAYPSPELIAILEGYGVKLMRETWTPPLENHPYGFIAAMVPDKNLREVLAISALKKIDTAERSSHAMNNTASQSVGASMVWETGFTGKGVKVGVLDSGIDTTYAGTDLPATFHKKDYSYYPALDNDVSNTTTGHGTHVAGTVLGRGVLSQGYSHTDNGKGAFKGMAPGTDLVFLKIGQDEDAIAEDFGIIGAIDAAVNIYHVDVLSMSYGGWEDFHDGSGPLDQKVDWAYGQGVPFFCSAGNAGVDGKHWMGTVPAYSGSELIEVKVSEPKGDTTMLRFNMVWSDGAKRNDLTIRYFDADRHLISDVTILPVTESLRGTESRYSYYNQSLKTAGTYYLQVVNNASEPQVVHIFEDWNNLRIGTDHVYFSNPEITYTVGSPSSADHAFSVGAYVTRNGWVSSAGNSRWWGLDYVENLIADFSSRGPTLDERVKPDLSAPGHILISLRDQKVYTTPGNSWIDNDGIPGGAANYYQMRGTSMACPVVSGSTALYLEKNPGATPQQVYDALKNTTNRTGLTNLPDNTYGAGRLDIYSAMKGYRDPMTINGDMSETNYQIPAVFNSKRNGFGDRDDISELKYYSDGKNIYIGVTGEITGNNNILIFMDFSGVQGRGAKTLGGGNSGDFVYCAFSYLGNVMMDFDVDFALGFNKGNSTMGEFFCDAIRYGQDANKAANIGRTNQWGTSSTYEISPVFGGTGCITFAFDSTFSADLNKGVEMKIPISAFAGVDSTQTVRFFAVITSQEGNVSNECIPGDPGANNLGDGADFSAIPNQDFFTGTKVLSGHRVNAFVISNEAPGCLIDTLIARGHGNKTIYQVMQLLQPMSGGVISPEFMNMLAASPPGSEIFTAQLKNYAGARNWGINICSDGTQHISADFGRNWYGKDGYSTYPATPTGKETALFTSADNQQFTLYNHGTNYGGGLFKDYYVFAIAWAADTLKAPGVLTGEILDLKADSALALGEVTRDSALAVMERGVVYSTAENPVIGKATKVAASAAGTGQFNAQLTGLMANTAYYARAFATNGMGTAYGENRRFTTPIRVINTPVGLLPQNLAVNKVTNKVYVANNIGNSVTVIDGSTGEVDTTVKVGTGPYYAGINEATNRIYVPNNIGNSVSVINGATNVVEATIPAGTGPRAAIANKVTNRIYVLSDYVANPSKVYVIDGKTNTVEKSVTVGQRPFTAAINEKTNKIYVANNFSKTVSVIDGATGNVETVNVGNTPRSIAVNDSTNMIYVVNYRDSSVTVIDGKTNATDTVKLPNGAFPWAATVNRMTNKVYVTNSGLNTVTVIDGATLNKKTIAVGKSPQAIAVNEATNRIYVGNFNKDDRSKAGYIVTEIDGTTEKIVGLAYRANPSELALNIKTNKTYVINGDRLMVVEETAPVISVTTDTLEIDGTGGSTASFNIMSNITWSVQPDQSWLTVTPGSGTGDGILKVTAGANLLGNNRQARIRVFMGKDTDTLSVLIIQKAAAGLAVIPDTLHVAQPGGSTGVFNITSTTNWTASSDKTWLSVTPVSETGNHAVTVTTEANTAITTRMAVVTITAPGAGSETVVVIQVAMAPELTVTTGTLTVASAAGSTAIFSITSNTAWTVQSDQTWLTASPGSGTGNGAITLSASANTITTSRSAMVTVSGTGVASKTVAVTQAPAEAILTVTPRTATIGADAGSTTTFVVTSTSPWTVRSDRTWLTVTPSSGSGNGQIVVTAAANGIAMSRIATVTVTSPGGIPQTVSVTQSALAAELSVLPALLTVASSGGSASSFSIASNADWSVSSNMDWLTVDPLSGNGNGTVIVRASANTTTSSRFATVTVSVTGLANQSVVVMQSAWSASLSVSPATLPVAAAEGSSGSFAVTSNTTWSVQSDQTWLTVNPATGTGNGAVTVTAAANPAAVIRTAMVLVTAAGATSETVAVQQAASTTSIRFGTAECAVIQVYPNPFREGIYLKNLNERVRIEVLDIGGRMMYQAEVDGSVYLPLDRLTDGFYLLKVYTDEGTVQRKIVKQGGR